MIHINNEQVFLSSSSIYADIQLSSKIVERDFMNHLEK